MAKILLVEDNELNRDMLSRRLTRRGYTVVVAEDGERGLDGSAKAFGRFRATSPADVASSDP